MEAQDLLFAVAAFTAAFVAGAMNAIAGGGTLVTFPVLLWLGLDSKTANATSTLALFPGLFGGLWGYRAEMGNSRRWLVRLGVPSVVGGTLGAWLLIETPTAVFDRLIPFLILFATILFMAQESIKRLLPTGGDAVATTGDEAAASVPRVGRWAMGGAIIQFCAATYGGYFGAGNGIMMLALLGVLGFKNIHQANGIKNFLAICINLIAVVLFSASGLVRWPEALVMAAGAILGGYFGANTARRLGKTFVRRTVIVIGLTITVVMVWRLWS